MKILLAVLSVLLVSLLHASQGTSYQGCYYEPENRVVGIGETFTPKGRCVSATCLENDNVVERACGFASAPCNKPRIENEDLSKPYPDCCTKLHCD